MALKVEVMHLLADAWVDYDIDFIWLLVSGLCNILGIKYYSYQSYSVITRRCVEAFHSAFAESISKSRLMDENS